MRFLKIVFTPPEPFQEEAEALTMLLESGGADIIHLRHPGTEEATLRSILDGIPERLRKRIRIHDFFGLAREYGLGGIHLNGRNPFPPDRSVSVSRSCHSVREAKEFLREYTDCVYVTLSPIFDSISKERYLSAKFDPEEVKSLTETGKAVALGGIEPRHFGQLAELGFSGGAMLGYVWNNPQGKKLPEIVEEINGHSR